jgi:hypothetical protein
METRWYALKTWSEDICKHTMELNTPEDLLHLEERLAYLTRAERADLALLRSRPYIQFRNSVITHLQQAGESSLKPGQVVQFWLAGIQIKVMDVKQGVRVWTGIAETEPLIDI